MLRNKAYLTAWLLTVSLSTAAWAGEKKPRVELKKIPDSTAMIVTLDGEMDLPRSAVQAVLCDYENHGKFSDVTEVAAILSAQEAQALEAAKPKDRSAVKRHAVTGKHTADCPGRAYVLTLMDYPFPVADGWSLTKYDAAVTGDTFTLKYQSVIGSSKLAGDWTVTALSATRSRMVMVTHVDMGISMPGFIMKWAVNSQMPDMFKAIEQEAKKRVAK